MSQQKESSLVSRCVKGEVQAQFACADCFSFIKYWTHHLRISTHKSITSASTLLSIMSFRESIRSGLKKHPNFSPWDYNCEEELPTSLSWMKVNVPNASDVFRWGEYQKCDIVLIETEGGREYGMIVRAFDDDKQGIQCVIAWVYTRQNAINRSFYSWPPGTKYLFSNHFQLIDSKCFVRPAYPKVRDALLVNYDRGIDFSSNKLVSFKERGNCIVKARTSMELSPFMNIPGELQDMVFEYLMDSEESEDGTVKSERTGPNSSPCWGLRHACKFLRHGYDAAYRRRALRLTLSTPTGWLE
jgi:hypothetical protein